MNPAKSDYSEFLDEKARYEQLMVQLRGLLGGKIEYVKIWLNSPHPDLGGLTPQFFIDEEKLEVVESLAWGIEVGQPG